MANSGLVVDCSMTMAWLSREEATPRTDSVLQRLRQEGASAPALWPLEVANVMLIGERRGRVTQPQGKQFAALLRGLPLVVDQEAPQRAFADILTLARTHGLTVYDAAYLELALRLGLPLATLDDDLRRAASALGVSLL